MSDEAEVGNRVNEGEDEGVSKQTHMPGLDKAHEARPLNARQKLAVESRLAKPLAPKTVWARDGQYSEWTAIKATERGIATDDKVARYLAEQRASGGPATKTLRSLRPKAIEALDRSLTLEAGERPDTGHLQAAGLALKLAQEAGEEDDGLEAQRSATYYARRDRRRALRAWQMGARFVLAHGADAASERAQELAAQIAVDTPYLDAVLPPRPPHGPLQKVFQRKGQ